MASRMITRAMAKVAAEVMQKEVETKTDEKVSPAVAAYLMEEYGNIKRCDPALNTDNDSDSDEDTVSDVHPDDIYMDIDVDDIDTDSDSDEKSKSGDTYGCSDGCGCKFDRYAYYYKKSLYDDTGKPGY